MYTYSSNKIILLKLIDECQEPTDGWWWIIITIYAFWLQNFSNDASPLISVKIFGKLEDLDHR